MLTLLACFSLLAADDPEVVVRARLDGALEVGKPAALVVEVTLADGTRADRAGLPAPLLQIAVPEGVALEGEHLATLAQQAKNELLEAPYERLLEKGRARVGFTLEREPAPDATIGLVVTGYLSGASGERFLRERVELPLVADAEARPGDDQDSRWGPPGDGRLAIGERAPLFELPRPDGSTVALESLLGQGFVLVTTFRAHW